MSIADTTQPRTQVKPFFFNTSTHLLRITKYKANTLSELLDGLRECPEESIFQHTFRTLQDHHFLSTGFSNDFAHWTLTACNDRNWLKRWQASMCASSLRWPSCAPDSLRSWKDICKDNPRIQNQRRG